MMTLVKNEKNIPTLINSQYRTRLIFEENTPINNGKKTAIVETKSAPIRDLNTSSDALTDGSLD